MNISPFWKDNLSSCSYVIEVKLSLEIEGETSKGVGAKSNAALLAVQSL